MIKIRVVQWLLLKCFALVFLTSNVLGTFTSIAYGQQQGGSGKSPASLIVTRQDEEWAKRLYNRVMQEFHKKDYAAALDGFRFFLELYGNSRLAASAQYWVGECEYRLGRYEDAIESFSVVMKVSQQKRKLAGATLKMGLAYEKLGQTQASRILFERLLNDFAGMPEVEIAKRHLTSSISAPLHHETEEARNPPITDESGATAAAP